VWNKDIRAFESRSTRSKSKAPPREKAVESYLYSRLQSIGLRCLKFIPDNRVGMPDRIILLPDQRVLWVELKTANGELAVVQKLRHRELTDAGHEVRVVWDKDDADALVEELTGRI